jgi:hypothetical protein
LYAFDIAAFGKDSTKTVIDVTSFYSSDVKVVVYRQPCVILKVKEWMILAVLLLL